MEQNGYTGLTTAQVLSNNSQSLSNNNGTINPILNIISDTFSAFTIGCVAVIEKGADPGKSNYLKNPFLIQKLETIASQTVSEGIKDPKLRKEVSDFYKNYYLQTLQKLIEDKSYTVANIPQLWPGDPAIIAEYSPEASSAWTTVKNDILSNIGTQSGIPNNGFLSAISKVFNITPDQASDASVRSLLRSDLKSHPNDYTTQSYQSSGAAYTNSDKVTANSLEGIVASLGATIFQAIAGTISQSMLHMAPYIQGYSLLLMYSFFPFIMIIVLLERKPLLLVEFLKNLFWIKSWSITWAILDVASSYVLTIQQALSGTSGDPSGYWQGPELAYFNIATAVFMIMLPILSRVAIDGISTGIGVAATAANIHADKSTDIGVRHTTSVGTTLVSDKITQIRAGGANGVKP